MGNSDSREEQEGEVLLKGGRLRFKYLHVLAIVRVFLRTAAHTPTLSQLQPGIHPFPELGLWVNNTMHYAGTMAFQRNFSSTSSIWGTKRGSTKNRLQFRSKRGGLPTLISA